MSLLAQRRAFLIAYRKHGSVEAAAAALQVDPSLHTEWMKDWLYRGAFAEVQAEMKKEAAVNAPPPPVPKRMGRPPKPKPENPPPKRPRGRPPLKPPVKPPEPAPPAAEGGSPGEPGAELPPICPQITPDLPPNCPPAETAPEPVVIPSHKGYTRLYVKEDELPAAPEPKPAPPKEEPPEAPLEITVHSDEQQKALVDEYGELDRRMQLRATDTARYESLKRAIKSWFAGVPADADGTVEGNVYLLHLSACERERKIRSLRELVDSIGLDKLLDLAVVPIGQLENLMGKAHVASLTVETRSGSRRIKAIPKRPAAIV